MSVIQPENPMLTVLRLLENRMRVIKDNESAATIRFSEENYERELLKNIDGHVTCSLLESQDQKLNLSGIKRRRVVFLKVVGTATNREMSSADPGRTMRDKITNQINDIIRECRQVPYETTYNFYGLGYPQGTPHKAKDGSAAAELDPDSGSWSELSAVDYQKVWANDDALHSKATSAVDRYPLMLFCFKIGKAANTDLQPLARCISKVTLTFVGYGTAALGDGATIKVWNKTASQWEQTQAGTGSSKQTLTITLTSAITDYVDANGYLWLLARTTNPSAGAATTLFCDFVQCVIQVRGLTYIDVVAYQNSDILEIKPFVHRTEFALRGWLFEDIP